MTRPGKPVIPLMVAGLAAAVVVSQMAACTDETTLQPRGRSPKAEYAAVVAQIVSSPGPDDQLARLDSAIGGLGGLRFEADGALTIVLRDTNDLDRRKGLVQAYVESRGRTVQRIRIEHGDFNFRELLAWKQQVATQKAAGITALSARGGTDQLWIGVLNESARSTVGRLAATLGIPSKAVDVSIFEPFMLTPGDSNPPPPPPPPPPPSQSLSSATQPYAAGLQILLVSGTVRAYCSMGPMVVRQIYDISRGWLTPDFYGSQYFVTASHCTKTPGGLDYDLVYQPDDAQARSAIGQEFADPALFTSATQARCPGGRLCQWADVALIQFSSFAQSSARTGSYLLTADDNPNAIIGTEWVNNNHAPFPGDVVYKTGANSGTTSGPVSNNCADVAIYELFLDGSKRDTGRTMLCQGISNNFARAGDSGGIVWEYYDTGHTKRWLVGTVGGGNASGQMYFSRWDWIWQVIDQDNGTQRGLYWEPCPLASTDYNGTNCP